MFQRQNIEIDFNKLNFSDESVKLPSSRAVANSSNGKKVFL